MEEEKTITDLKIFSSKDYPMLVFEYTEDKGKKMRQHLGQVLREYRKIK